MPSRVSLVALSNEGLLRVYGCNREVRKSLVVHGWPKQIKLQAVRNVSDQRRLIALGRQGRDSIVVVIQTDFLSKATAVTSRRLRGWYDGLGPISGDGVFFMPRGWSGAAVGALGQSGKISWKQIAKSGAPLADRTVFGLGDSERQMWASVFSLRDSTSFSIFRLVVTPWDSVSTECITDKDSGISGVVIAALWSAGRDTAVMDNSGRIYKVGLRGTEATWLRDIPAIGDTTSFAASISGRVSVQIGGDRISLLIRNGPYSWSRVYSRTPRVAVADSTALVNGDGTFAAVIAASGEVEIFPIYKGQRQLGPSSKPIYASRSSNVFAFVDF